MLPPDLTLPHHTCLAALASMELGISVRPLTGCCPCTVGEVARVLLQLAFSGFLSHPLLPAVPVLKYWCVHICTGESPLWPTLVLGRPLAPGLSQRLSPPTSTQLWLPVASLLHVPACLLSPAVGCADLP